MPFPGKCTYRESRSFDARDAGLCAGCTVHFTGALSWGWSLLSRRMPARIEVAVASAERGTYRAFFDQGSGYGPNRAFVNEIAHIKQGRAWPLLRRSGDEEKTVTTCEQGGHRANGQSARATRK